MAENTAIEWADHTFNPWTGCTKISPGCDHCYAEGWAKRSGTVQWGPHAERRRTTPANWRKPLQWNERHAEFFAAHGRRQRVFCASLADWLDNQVPIEWLVDLLDLWRLTPNLDKLALTKRIGNWRKRLEDALEWMSVTPAAYASLIDWVQDWLDGDAPRGVLLGATVVNQEEADRDVPKLLTTPAAGRFLSMEPMLGPIDLTRIDIGGHGEIYPLRGTTGCEDDDGDPLPDLPAINWVICGGESGPGGRPMHPDWARSLRDQCATAGVPFLFKQWGDWAPGRAFAKRDLGHWMSPTGRLEAWAGGAPRDKNEVWTLVYRVGKKAAGRLLDGVEHNGFPEPAHD